MMAQRLYTKDNVVTGIKALERLQQKSFEYPPMAQQTMELPEMLDGHCTGCKSKKTFQVAGTESMKNGALRKWGSCPNEKCGRTISTFVSGASEGG